MNHAFRVPEESDYSQKRTDVVSRCELTRLIRGRKGCLHPFPWIAVVILAFAAFPSTLSAHPFLVLSSGSEYALQDTIRTDSVVILDFPSSKRLERAHRDTKFIWNFAESEGGVPDSLSRGAYQRLLAQPRDSSARIKNFTYTWKEQPQVPLFGPPEYPSLLLQPSPQTLQWSAQLDSTGTYVVIRETMGQIDVRIPLIIPLEEYIRLSLEASKRQMIATRAHEYTIKGETKDDFGALLGSVTKIEIPVPANPVFSIFGKPSISLNISGDVNIQAAYRSITQDQLVTSLLGNTRNEPDFSQVVRLNVDGLIGDKLAIRANWDTQTQFEYENRLSLVYTGYDDEIVKKVEAGNVSLSTPSAFIGSSQALFGIKTTMQFGPLTLTALASQKKGQVQELSVSGGSQNQTFTIYPYQYSTNHYYIDKIYRENYEKYYNTNLHQADPSIMISDIEVYKSRYGTTSETGNEKPGVAFLNLPPAPPSYRYDDSFRDSTARQGEIEIGTFVKLDPTAYTIERASGILTLNTNVQDGEIIAVAYRTNNGLTFGEFSAKADTSKARVLKLVKPATLVPSMTAAWELLVKNRYPIGGRGLKKDKFDLDIYYNPPGQPKTDQLYGQSLLQVFGLDKLNDAGESTPNNKFDFISGFTIDQDRGELIFPTLEPFRNAIPDWWTSHKVTSDVPADSLTYPDIYDTTLTIAQQSPRSRYTIEGTYSSDVNAKYSIGFNVVENSVQVLLDGVPLQPGSDFTVDYNLGEVTIRRDDALVPGKNLQIKYEQNDLFQMASKTMTALRGDLRLAQNANLGFTLMNYNQQTLSDKVRLGEEPMSNTMLGFDGSAKINTPFLTDALNLIPGYYSREMSMLSVKADAAYMMPNPNTASSPIQSDGGKGVAYIDDFEGMKQTVPLGVGYSSWHYASPPKYIMNLDPDPVDSAGNVNTDLSIPDTMKTYYKGWMYWYNELPSPIQVTDIWPERKAAIDQMQVTALTVHYDPTQRGVFNYSTYPDTTYLKDPAKNDWCGIMKVVSTASTNLIDENINYIEFWMKISKADADELKKAKLLIDLGRISEDVIPNGILNTEDGVHGKPPNDRLMDDEDVGLDGLTDAEEQARWPTLGTDPSRDDWQYTLGGSYEHVNGTEGNGKSETGKIPDTEDINHNGNLDVINSYFEYEVPLDTTGGFHSTTNPFIVGGGLSTDKNKLWYQFRIPLIKPTRRIGSPSLETVQFIRLWFAGTAKPVEVQIVELELTGSQWIEAKKDDSTMTVSSVSIEETPGYVSPPGVVRERDKTKPNEDVLANEQSLVLKVRGMKAGDSREAIKYFTYKPLDIFSYRTLKMFVRSDPNFKYADTSNYDAQFFIKFGLDSVNYYEYRTPLRPPSGSDPDGQWTMNNIEINFSELTGIKQKRDSTNQTVTVLTRAGPPGSTYSVRGQPTLTQIKMISMGVSNTNRGGMPISGDVWADEMRVTDVDATKGWAVRAETQLKLSDLSLTSFSISRIDPYFHSIDQRFGTRNTNMNWSFDTRWTLERLLPRSWVGSAMTVSYTHTEQLSNPLFLPGTDVLTTEAAQRTSEKILEQTGSDVVAKMVRDSILAASQTLFVTDTWAIPGIRLGIPSRSWYVDDLLNKIVLGFTYTKSNERSPSVASLNRWSWNATASYNLTFGLNNYVSPFQSMFDQVPVVDFMKGWRFFYTPQTFSVSMSAQRGRTNEVDRVLFGLKPVQRTFTANRALAFVWKFTENGIANPSLDYSLNITSSLAYLEVDSLGNQRPFSMIMKDVFGKDRLVNFGIDDGYDQRITLGLKPRVPSLFNLDRYLDVQSGYTSGYHWSYAFQQQDLGKSSTVGTSLTLTSTLKLRSLSDAWFGKTDAIPDSLKPAIDYKQILRTAIKTPFLEFETINISFTQTGSAQNSGVPGRPGFLNFWGVAPFQDPVAENGPSRLYQLGLISTPTDRLTNFRIRPSFPFFSFDLVTGLRAPNGVLVDNFMQSNRISVVTSRDLWKGAKIDLKWNVGWSFNRNTSLTTDSLGQSTISNITTTGDVERSYFTMPQLLFFKPFKSGVGEVGRIFNSMSTDTADVGEKLATAFEQGFETMPLLSKVIGNLVPRMNYSFRWDGLEKLPFVRDIATRVSLDHAYQSTFTRQWRSGPTGMTTESERITYGYQPLANLSIQFKEFWKGSLSGNVKYSTNTTYDLNIATTTVLEAATSDIGVTINYSRRGFEIPLFGLSLSNDLDASLSYTYSKNSQKTYTPDQLETNGTPYEGSTRTVLEPRIKYVLSMRVSASMYYRKTSIEPAEGSRTIGQSTSEFGFDIKLSIGQ